MRVLLTRSAEDSARTARRLASHGHDAVIAPLTAIVATGTAPPSVEPDAAILTSAHAVPALVTLGTRAPVFAVGRRTAEAAREAGFPTVSTAQGDAADLAALVRRSLPPGAAMLHVAGRHRKAEPEASLRAAGFRVNVWEAYEACAVPRLPDNLPPLLEAGRIDAALHYSRRSAGLLVDLCAREGLLPSFRGLAHVCLSADVAVPLSAVGIAPAIAAEPNEEALLAALDSFPRRQGSPPRAP
jgi:uroporphyrinogen-III synthase